VLLLDKPIGLTSNAALQRVKRLLTARKAGHTGSLDPLASGLLPICLGEATKLAGLLLDTDKRYRTIVRLGATTDTADATGQQLTCAPVPALDAEAIEGILAQFRGRIEQVPPMYSALKQSGVRLYDLARRGIEVDRPKRSLEIHELTLVGYSHSELELDVHCSKGTYIRVLAEDIGRALGCGAYLKALRRTAVGPWTVDRALTLDALQEREPADRRARIEPMDLLVADLPRVICNDDACFRLSRGQTVPAPCCLEEGSVRLYDALESFLGIGEYRRDGTIAPRRMFNLPHTVSHPKVTRGIDKLSSE
jgi:tRNA pseudouridine55 synthase